MASKIKDIINSPYAAPLTQPFKNVAAFTLYPLKSLVAGVKGQTLEGNTGEAFAGIATLLGGVTGAIGLGTFTAGSAFSALGASAPAIKLFAALFAGLAGGVAGALGGAISGVGAVTAVAGVIGLTLGFVPGIFQGFYKAYKHHQELKNPTVLVGLPKPAPWPAPPLAPPPRNPSGLPPKNIGEQLAEKSPEERLKLLEELKEKFAHEFSTIAQKQAHDAIHTPVSRPLKVNPPLRIRPRKNPPTDA